MITMDINDLEIINLFQKRINELKETTLVKNQANISITFSAKRGENLHIDGHMPKEDDLKSFIMSLSFFLL